MIFGWPPPPPVACRAESNSLGRVEGLELLVSVYMYHLHSSQDGPFSLVDINLGRTVDGAWKSKAHIRLGQIVERFCDIRLSYLDPI